MAEANIGQDLMPTEKRGAIGQVKPTGWHTVKYDQVEGKYLYNRCHLIGYQLTGENANEKNLITGTRYLNVEGMLPFENMVADYVKETGNHVLYRVTPIFTGDDLVADGVEMEALSMEDDGEGISFHIFAYNNQPGISINYATGDSTLSESSGTMTDQQEYVMNTSSMKFHLPSCSSVSSIKDENKATYQGPREDLIAEGYEPCGRCNPYLRLPKQKFCQTYHVINGTMFLIFITKSCFQFFHRCPDFSLRLATCSKTSPVYNRTLPILFNNMQPFFFSCDLIRFGTAKDFRNRSIGMHICQYIFSLQ